MWYVDNNTKYKHITSPEQQPLQSERNSQDGCGFHVNWLKKPPTQSTENVESISTSTWS